MKFDALLLEYGYNGLIPTNTIINKVRTGIGATTAELLANRHSIIIEPHVTALEVKKNEYGDKLCIVKDGVANLDILDYLTSPKIKIKKIMTTADSFKRMINQLSVVYPNYRQEFFLLYDEQHVLIEQPLFRPILLQPLDELFAFTNKALITATPLIPTDSRFDLHMFRYVEFKPSWDYRQDLKLITTDNIRTSLRNQLDLFQDNRPVFIFTNCGQTILYLTRLETVSSDFKVFCAERLDKEFFTEELVNNVSYSIADQKYAKYNFFTSRFFASVDMFPDVQPHVLMITNTPLIKYSQINPRTHAIQIVGRCRDNVASVTHVTNLNTNLSFKSEEEIADDINFSVSLVQKLKVYEDLLSHSCVEEVTRVIIGKEFAKTVLESDNETENSYFKDCYKLDKNLENIYSNTERLIKAYEDSGAFRILHKSVKHIFTDLDRLKIDKLKGRRKAIALVEKLVEMETALESGQSIDEDGLADFHRMIEKEEVLFKVYCKLGVGYLTQVKFQKTKIRKAYLEIQLRERQVHYADMMDEILTTFKLNINHYTKQLKSRLQGIYNKYDYRPDGRSIKTAVGTDILTYFEGKKREPKRPHPKHKYETYYILTSPKYKLSDDITPLYKP